MKSWSLLCFLVLAVSSLSRGQDSTTQPPYDGDGEDTASKMLSDGQTTVAKTPTPILPVLPSNASGNGTTHEQDDGDVGDYPDIFEDDRVTNESATNVSDSSAKETTTSASSPESSTMKKAMKPSPVTKVESPKATTTQRTGAADEQGGSSWAYVVLVLIILVIIVLCSILYFLRRVSRSYSFDLQRPVQTNRLDEPIGTFEQVYLDDLDQPAPKEQIITDDVSPAPVANGTTLPSEEKMSNGENGNSPSAAPENQPDEIDVESLPSDYVSAPPGDEQADDHSSNSTNLFFEAAGEDLNENNNNNDPSICSTEPFVEINLDDPALCDQLLTPPVASPFVIPFSSFSFSSTSLT